MKLVTQGSSVTVRVRLKDGQKWIDFGRVENLSVTLFNSNMNRRTSLVSGNEYTVHGDTLTLLLDKRLTERIGKYRALLLFDQNGLTIIEFYRIPAQQILHFHFSKIVDIHLTVN